MTDQEIVQALWVFVPLRGLGCFRKDGCEYLFVGKFPSPSGVWVVSFEASKAVNVRERFPSPCGVWVVSKLVRNVMVTGTFPSPSGVWVAS